jgi:hypothetical protein
VIVRDAGMPSRWRPLIAIVAALCLLSALAGSWAVRFGPAASAAPQAVTVFADVGPQPAAYTDHHTPSSTNDKSFKTAGIKRDRPPNWSRSAPPEWWLPAPSSLITSQHRPGAPHSRAPATPRDGQELLHQLCVARC